MRGTIHARKTIRGSISYPTLKGDPGEDGYSPQASVMKTGNTATITITDKSGTTTAQVTDGAKGDTGRTPEITANRTGDTTTIYSDSTPIAEIHDGTPGQDGDPGPDGVSPSATVTQTSSGATITITDKTGTTTANVANGEPGQDGHTPVKGTDYWTQADQTAIVNDVLESQAISDIQSDLNEKLTAPQTAGTQGQVLTSDGQGGQSWEDPTGGGGTVTDVQVNGVSVLDAQTGEANIPIGSGTTLGVVKTANSYGLTIGADGTLKISAADAGGAKVGTGVYKPIVPLVQHASTFYGLAKAAGDTTQSASSNAVGNYTDNAKAAIKAMLDITGECQTVTVTGTTPTITATKNTRYVCGEVAMLDFTPSASGICDVIFTSGSTATVLTLPNTVILPSWFDATTLEANTTYEISISDGVYGAVMAWQ